MKFNKQFVRCGAESDEWIDRIAADPEGQRKRKKDNQDINAEKSKLLAEARQTRRDGKPMAVLPHFPTLRLSRERKPNAFPLHSPFSAAAQSSQKPAASDLSSRTISCSSHSPVSRNASQSSTLTSSLVYLSRKEKPAPGFSGSADLLRIFAFLTFPLLKIYMCVCV